MIKLTKEEVQKKASQHENLKNSSTEELRSFIDLLNNVSGDNSTQLAGYKSTQKECTYNHSTQICLW